MYEEQLLKKAQACALRYLQRMDRTEQQLRQKLAQQEYPQEIIDQATEYVRSFHYIDDVRYAVNYMTGHMDGRGVRRMEQELYQRGISREDFEAALAQIELPDEETQIRRLLEKKQYPGAGAQQSERERMIGFLLRRGYRMSAIQHVLLDIASKTG